MRVMVIYRGALEKEIIECKDYFAHSSGGWGFKIEDDSMIFISSADVRKIYKITEEQNAST